MPMKTGGKYTIHTLYRRGCEALAVLPCASFDAFQLLRAALGLRDRGDLALRGEETVPEASVSNYLRLLARRCDGEPLQYILGVWEFYGYEFEVGPGVLIPRADTELLAQAVIDGARALPAPRLLELCAGSGCIALTAALELPQSCVTAVELYPEAFSYLRRNLARHPAAHVTAVQADVFALPEAVSAAQYDLIFSNPPYIADAVIPTLQCEVQREPVTALAGGKDGLDFYRAIPAIARPMLPPGGLLALEIGEEQAAAVAALLEASDYGNLSVLQDVEGRDRVVTARRK